MTIGDTATITKAAGTPVSECLLIPFGHVQVERAVAGRDFVFTRRHAESAVRWFNHTGRRLAIDYEHQSIPEYNQRADKLAPAAGWIGRLEVRAGGVWACDVEWNDRAKTLLATGEYAYFSPVIHWTDADYSDVQSLGPVALTNEPAMSGAQPLVATQRKRGTAMFCTVLAARPLPLSRSTLKLGGMAVAEPDAGLGPAAEVQLAVEEFADRVDWPLFRDAMSEGLVNVIAAAFTDDDARVLTELSSVIEQFASGANARDIFAEFLFNTSSEGNTGSSRVAASRARSDAREADAAARGRYATTRALRSEFDSPETYAAYVRASHAGQVGFCAKTRQRLASRAAPSRLVGRGTVAADAELEREFAASPELQKEFSSVANYVAFKKHDQAGHVQILGSGRGARKT